MDVAQQHYLFGKVKFDNLVQLKISRQNIRSPKAHVYHTTIQLTSSKTDTKIQTRLSTGIARQLNVNGESNRDPGGSGTRGAEGACGEWQFGG